jgi:hypothetical protein
MMEEPRYNNNHQEIYNNDRATKGKPDVASDSRPELWEIL